MKRQIGILMVVGLLLTSGFSLPLAAQAVQDSPPGPAMSMPTPYQHSMEVAPYWVYTGQIPTNNLTAIEPVTVAPYWVYINPSPHLEALSTARNFEVAPNWVYVGPLPGLLDK